MLAAGYIALNLAFNIAALNLLRKAGECSLPDSMILLGSFLAAEM